MSKPENSYITTAIQPEDAKAGFSCGKHSLDDYFARHAVLNDATGISRAYVLRRDDNNEKGDLPVVLGFYTLSMALVESSHVAKVIEKKLPKYSMPVALVGRLAIDKRAHGRRLGEKLLTDALRRVVDASGIVGCIGVIVDAKDEGAEKFYEKYDFVTVTDMDWPRRMFLPIATVRSAFESNE